MENEYEDAEIAADRAQGIKGWFAARCECRVCGHKQISVFPHVEPEIDDNLECSQCGNMTSEAVEYFPPQATIADVDAFLASLKDK